MPSAEAIERQAGRVGRSLREAGFSLHQCKHGRLRHSLGGVCLLRLPARAGEHQAGAAVSWTTDNRVLRDSGRRALHSELDGVMNKALGGVLCTLGYRTEPLGAGGSWLVTAEQGAEGGVTRR